MFLAYPFLALASLLFAALTMVLAPVLTLFSDADGNLPGALRLFQTFDATLDAGWRDGYFGDWKAKRIAPKRLCLWWLRTRWLWRNPGYTFDYEVLGCAFDPMNWRVLRYSAGGSKVTFLAVGPRLRFNLYLQRGNFYLKLGWKAWNYWDGVRFDGKPWGPEARAPICFTIKP